MHAQSDKGSTGVGFKGLRMEAKSLRITFPLISKFSLFLHQNWF